MNSHRTAPTLSRRFSAQVARRSGPARLAAAAACIAVAACNDLPLTPDLPAEALLSVCHMSGVAGTSTRIAQSALAAHRSHGDYVVDLVVDKASTATGDSIHFTRIGDALAVARAIRSGRNETSTGSCRITITVEPGIFQGSVKESADPSFERLPLVIDMPDVTLHGSFSMPMDESGRAFGMDSPSTLTSSTTLVASPGLISISTGVVADKFAEPLIVVNAHPEGLRGDGTIIEGFVFQSGNTAANAVVGGNAVWAMRAQRLVVRRNQIEGGFAEPVEMRASHGRIEDNYLTGRGGSCALCIFGPGDYTVIGNRQVGLSNRLAVLVFPAIVAAVPPGVEQFVPPATSMVTAAVANNDFRDHQEAPFGIGVRIAAIGPGAPNVTGTARVVVQDNDLSNNRFAVVAEAGFPVAATSRPGNIDLTLVRNIMTGSCQTPVLVALTNQPTAAGLQNAPPLRNSSYSIRIESGYDDSDINWGDVWYSHPAGTGNTLTVDGQPIAYGARVPYDAAKVCPVVP